ncbi:MAG TPA: DUF72 domain-containing protein, partial [Steroidobacteraceae bacterium]|nr:DUF72 domain-containing protein [Steroidobacteraceae bacterium]
RQLTSIEINSTFYRLQKPQTFQKWHDETPEEFVFSVKAPRFVMHRNRLAEAATAIERFLGSGLLRLARKLGPINWQLSPEKPFDAREITDFLALLPQEAEGRPLRHALEARHPSFDCEEFFALARQRGVAVVEAGDSDYPHLVARTASFSYLRLMGSKTREPKGYSAAALGHWHRHAATLQREGDVFLYFISGAKQRNPLAAREMRTFPDS